MRFPLAVLFAVALAVPLPAADPPVAVKILGPSLTTPDAGAAIPVPAGRFIPVMPASGLPVYIAEERAYRVYMVKPGGSFAGVKWDAPADAEPEAYSWPDSKGPVYVILARGYVGTYSIQPIKNGATATDPPSPDGAALRIQILAGPRPPPPDPVPPGPVPPGPVPPGPTPPPQPVTSFRVIWVTESATVLTPQQNSVIGAKVVRDYLTAKTTPENNWAGWRHYDPQTIAANDQPTMKALWSAVQPKLTTKEAMVVEVNGKADILPFPANAAEAFKTLKSYGGQ